MMRIQTDNYIQGIWKYKPSWVALSFRNVFLTDMVGTWYFPLVEHTNHLLHFLNRPILCAMKKVSDVI